MAVRFLIFTPFQELIFISLIQSLNFLYVTFHEEKAAVVKRSYFGSQRACLLRMLSNAGKSIIKQVLQTCGRHSLRRASVENPAGIGVCQWILSKHLILRNFSYNFSGLYILI